MNLNAKCCHPQQNASLHYFNTLTFEYYDLTDMDFSVLMRFLILAVEKTLMLIYQPVYSACIYVCERLRYRRPTDVSIWL